MATTEQTNALFQLMKETETISGAYQCVASP